ncbi:hypothetical protein [uncultured Phascolarctobacterium sp.]|uniref:hypothetical protein n=1 Tax=uncultured Phascolarctobacterium sp. TaxID=512296 RepID=UPI0025E14955|nr:hypothetical protein [uncultured Phascolarctobacterium sp.]
MASNYIDPAFQIGMMLGDAYGNMWAANAKKRQGAKADDIIEQMQNQRAIQRIADARRAGISDEDAVQVITDKIARQAGAQGATQATGIGQLNQPSIDFMGMGAQMAEQQDPYKLSVPSPLDQLKGAGGKEYSINKALQANQNALNKEKEAQAVLASNPTAQAAYNWNPDYTEDNVRKALRKAGLAKDVIDEKVGEVKSDIAKRAEAVLLPSIRKKMFYGYDTVEKGEDGNLYPVHHDPDAVSFMQAMAELETLKQYSPDTYKTYAGQIVGPLALYNERVADKRYDKQVKVARENAEQQHEWNVADTILANKLATERAKVTAAYRQSLVNAGRTGGRAGLKMSDIKELVELGKSALESDNPALQRRGQQILAQAYSLLGGDNSGGSVFANRDPDWNNYNDVMTAAHEVLNAGGSKEQVATKLKQHMGDGELYRKVISDLGIGSTNNSSSPSSTSKKTDVQEILFPKPDNDTWLHWLTNDDDHTTVLQRLGAK